LREFAPDSHSKNKDIPITIPLSGDSIKISYASRGDTTIVSTYCYNPVVKDNKFVQIYMVIENFDFPGGIEILKLLVPTSGASDVH